MTDEQMNEFLESIGGLIPAYYTEKPKIISSHFFSCGSGWNLIIKSLIEDLITLGWDKQICQIKEKFGGLRFYINDGSDEIYKRISEAEEQSYNTCEVTGKPGKLRNDIGWWTTLCDEEYQKVLAKRK